MDGGVGVDGRAGGLGGDTPGTIDDTAMQEVLTRRFRRYLEDTPRARATSTWRPASSVASPMVGTTLASALRPWRRGQGRPGRRPGRSTPVGRPRRFAYPPSLVVVDGGLPQVNAAQAVLDELGIEEVALVGLAKRLEEVWLPRTEHPVILPRTSEGLYLLQRLRDEAHRFAITFHRQRRSKAMTSSQLDGIPGLGASRQKALLKHFGSVKRLRAADVEEIKAVPRSARRLPRRS